MPAVKLISSANIQLHSSIQIITLNLNLITIICFLLRNSTNGCFNQGKEKGKNKKNKTKRKTEGKTKRNAELFGIAKFTQHTIVMENFQNKDIIFRNKKNT